VNLPHHRLSHEFFAALAAGGGGCDAVCELAATQYSKHVILLCGVLTAARDSEQYQHARTGFDLLAAAWRENRLAAEEVIRYPSVGTWARRTIQACRGGPAMPGAEPGGLRMVGAAAALRAAMSAEIEVAVTDGRVILPSLGAAVVQGHTAMVRSGKSHAEVGPVELPRNPHQDAPGWLGLRRVRAGSLDVLIDDLDPFRIPDAPDLALRLPDERWDAAVAGAWRLLQQYHPEVAAEVAAVVSVIVPRSQPSGRAVSTTSPEAFGAIAMSLPPDPVTGAETLVHEVQHLKLGALLDIVTMTLPDDGQLYYAPWRDDPRPVQALLQGAYAYLGVSRFWRRQRQFGGQRWADAEYARWRTATALAVETLRSSGRLTSAGMDFVGEMARTLAPWQDEPVPTDALARAARAAESHQTQWQSVHGPDLA
jgi:HEXXH motif-containing protein